MSCYLVGQDTINIVAAAIVMGNDLIANPWAPRRGARWVVVGLVCAANADAYRARYGGGADAEYYERDIQMWLSETKPSADDAINNLKSLTPVMRANVVRKALNCYRYQCGEGDVISEYDFIFGPIEGVLAFANIYDEVDVPREVYSYGE